MIDERFDPGEHVEVVTERVERRPLSLKEIAERDEAREVPAPKPKRTKRQQNEDAILTEAEDLIRAGRDQVLEGVDIFSSLQEPQHKNLETILGQALEQVIAYRALKR